MVRSLIFLLAVLAVAAPAPDSAVPVIPQPRAVERADRDPHPGRKRRRGVLGRAEPPAVAATGNRARRAPLLVAHSRRAESRTLRASPGAAASLDAGRHFFPTAFVKRLHRPARASQDERPPLAPHRGPGLAHRDHEVPAAHRVGRRRVARPSTATARATAASTRRTRCATSSSTPRRAHVTVVPEIEMPGHARAAIAAYPELGCTGEPTDGADRPGASSRTSTARQRGRRSRSSQDVLDEVLALFPSRVHPHRRRRGARRTTGRPAPTCQARMRPRGCSDESELQSYFVRRIERVRARARAASSPAGTRSSRAGWRRAPTVQVWRDVATIATTASAGARRRRVAVEPRLHQPVARGPPPRASVRLRARAGRALGRGGRARPRRRGDAAGPRASRRRTST